MEINKTNVKSWLWLSRAQIIALAYTVKVEQDEDEDEDEDPGGRQRRREREEAEWVSATDTSLRRWASNTCGWLSKTAVTVHLLHRCLLILLALQCKGAFSAPQWPAKLTLDARGPGDIIWTHVFALAAMSLVHLAGALHCCTAALQQPLLILQALAKAWQRHSVCTSTGPWQTSQVQHT